MQHAPAEVEDDPRRMMPRNESAARELEKLVSSRLPYFYSVANRFLANAADAEDVVQDALLTAHKHLNQFRGDSQLSTWLTTIVCNCARMHLRKRSLRIQMSLDDPIGVEHQSTLSEQLAWGGLTPEDQCRRSEMNRHLAQAAARLTPVLRATLQLRDVEGLSIREAAKIRGVANGTVKAQLSRARARMRQLLSQRRSRTRRATVACTC